MALAALAVVGLLGAGFVARGLVGEESGSTASTESTASAASESTDQQSVSPKVSVSGTADEPAAAVAEALGPAVVQIQTTEGLGSGVIYDSSGLILTNAHVVGQSSSLTVSLADGKQYPGTVVGADTNTDIAVVRISGAGGLTAARLATTPPKVGQAAIALGSPFGFKGTVTEGIVSAVNRPVDNQSGSAVNMIQTDAPINPGNSGGALANRNGEVIGINSSIYSQSGDNNGIGFAVPIDIAKQVADKIVNGGSLDRAGLGISGSDSPNGDAGAYVRTVTSGGAAATAGIKDGDLIVGVDGKPISDMASLRAAIGTHNPGDKVTLDIQRGGQRTTVTVTLGTLPSGNSSGSPRSGGRITPGNPGN